MKNPTAPIRYITSTLILCNALAPLSFAANKPEFPMPEILLARNYGAGIDPTIYYVSEKLDGVRALWDGSVLRFRSGRVINAPAWFTAKFPLHALDGELWMGRHRFDQISSTVRKVIPEDDAWKMISYQVYELPNGFGSFEDRLTALKLTVKKVNVPWLRVLHQFTVTNDDELQLTLNQYVQSGSEGLMLHRRDSVWQTGRSDVLLKLKMVLDADAKVIGHEPGKGKYKGMMGALQLEMPNGIRFRLGSGFSDEQRRFPPEIGSAVTYQYRDLTPQGVPKFANFLRIRVEE